MPHGDVKIGCCGFPVSRKKYFATFCVVELQKTFYHPPEPKTIERWAKESPSGFEYTIKAWQLITHPPTSPTYRRLGFKVPEEKHHLYGFFRPTEEVFSAWQTIREIALLLGSRLVLFQTPSSFEPTEENTSNMKEFFHTIERAGLTLMWEPRGKWQPDTIKALCRELKLIHVVDPFKDSPLWGNVKYFRLHGRGGYKYRYTDEDFHELAAFIDPKKPTYFMFNNVYMFEDATRFREYLCSEGLDK